MAEIIRLVPEVAGENYRVEPSAVLGAAGEAGFNEVMVIGICPEGGYVLSSSCSIAQCVMMMEAVKLQILMAEIASDE